MAERGGHHEPGADEFSAAPGIFNDGRETDEQPFEAPAGLPTSPEFVDEALGRYFDVSVD